MLKHTLLASLLLSAILSVALSSCENANLPGDDDDVPTLTGKKYKVNIVTRATGSEIMYPVSIVAKDGNGNIVARQTLSSATEAMSLQLPEGGYSITATSGSTDFSRGYTTTPLLVGHTDITVKTSSVNANIIMSYAVTSLDITLRDLPATVTAATAALSPMGATVDADGTASGTATVTVPCVKKADGVWATGKVYTLPGTGANTVLTLAVTTDSGTESYGVTYFAPLRASVPYRFTGEFSGAVTPSDFEVTGTLTAGSWESEVTGTFSFGPQGTNAFGQPTGGDVYTVTAMPQTGSLWNGHIVAYVASDGNALLLSTQEWSGMTSALYEEDPYVAANIAARYGEASLTDWGIPTHDQAQTLMDTWSGSKLEPLNAVLTAASLQPLLTKDGGSNVRYLCSDAESTYSFSSTGNKFNAAGATVKTYRLRLVKAVRFVVG